MSREITFRRYTPADEAAVLALKRQQDKVLGQPMDFCDLTRHPVLISEVGVLDGAIVGAHALEAVPEYCVFSRDPRFTAAAMQRGPLISRMLQQNGFRSIRCLVPEWIGADAETIASALQSVGFAPHTGCRHMVLDLRVRPS